MELIKAIKNNDLTKVRKAIGGTSIDELDKIGYTPLYWAVVKGNIDLVEILINHGAKIDKQNRLGESPLMRVVLNKDKLLVKILLEKGANPNLRNMNGETSLHKAALNNDLEIMKLLVEYGGDIHAVDNFGFTIMHNVALGAELHGDMENWELTEWLLEQGAPYDTVNEFNETVHNIFFTANWLCAKHFKELVASIAEATSDSSDYSDTD